jgi:hypothetical protein
VGRLLSLVRRNATYKGVLGGSRGWMGVFVVLGTARLFGKYVGREPQRLTTEKLAPGQSLLITTGTPPTRAERRAQRRATQP